MAVNDPILELINEACFRRQGWEIAGFAGFSVDDLGMRGISGSGRME
ncbi:MAG: hypothetical protein NT038_01275 [Euryarchaeota archaeon]|nr:hypothetical protein [Euryarchaeota archaeon]